MGYRFQFITLAGFHSLNAAMFELAAGYAAEGMPAYVRLQQHELALEPPATPPPGTSARSARACSTWSPRPSPPVEPWPWTAPPSASSSESLTRSSRIRTTESVGAKPAVWDTMPDGPVEWGRRCPTVAARREPRPPRPDRPGPCPGPGHARRPGGRHRGRGRPRPAGPQRRPGRQGQGAPGQARRAARRGRAAGRAAERHRGQPRPPPGQPAPPPGPPEGRPGRARHRPGPTRRAGQGHLHAGPPGCSGSWSAGRQPARRPAPAARCSRPPSRPGPRSSPRSGSARPRSTASTSGSRATSPRPTSSTGARTTSGASPAPRRAAPEHPGQDRHPARRLPGGRAVPGRGVEAGRLGRLHVRRRHGPVLAPGGAGGQGGRPLGPGPAGRPLPVGRRRADRFDCSGLTSSAYRAAGVTIPRVSRAQWGAGPHVAVDNLLPGDLIFYGDNPSNPASIHHVGMYIGNGLMVHAPHTGDVVRVASIWRESYVGATRIVPGVVTPGAPPPPLTARPADQRHPADPAAHDHGAADHRRAVVVDNPPADDHPARVANHDHRPAAGPHHRPRRPRQPDHGRADHGGRPRRRRPRRQRPPRRPRPRPPPPPRSRPPPRPPSTTAPPTTT